MQDQTTGTSRAEAVDALRRAAQALAALMPPTTVVELVRVTVQPPPRARRRARPA
jgi:hypothetical protein